MTAEDYREYHALKTGEQVKKNYNYTRLKELEAMIAKDDPVESNVIWKTHMSPDIWETACNAGYRFVGELMYVTRQTRNADFSRRQNMEIDDSIDSLEESASYPDVIPCCV